MSQLQFKFKLLKAHMVCFGFESGAAGLKTQTNPLSYNGTPEFSIFMTQKSFIASPPPHPSWSVLFVVPNLTFLHISALIVVVVCMSSSYSAEPFKCELKYVYSQCVYGGTRQRPKLAPAEHFSMQTSSATMSLLMHYICPTIFSLWILHENVSI